MGDRHYLGFRGMFGGRLQHVATGSDGEGLPLFGWCAEAFKVKGGNAWIGSAPEQQHGCLRLVANNQRDGVQAGPVHGTVPGAGEAGILAERGVAHTVVAVLHGLVAPVQGQQACRGDRLGIERGDEAGRLGARRPVRRRA